MTPKQADAPWLWVTVPLALALAVSTSVGLFAKDFYRADSPLMHAQLLGGDVVTLTLLLPVLIVSALLARRGSMRATVVWLGCLCFLTYFYLVFSFQVSFNAMFPLYLVLLGGAVYGLVFGLTGTFGSDRFDHAASDCTARTVAVALGLIPVLFYAMELGEVVSGAVSGTAPESVVDFGAPTYFAHVIDMALSLPAYAIGAILLWQRKRMGYILGGALLTILVFMMVALLSMFVVQSHRDIDVATADVAVIGTVALGYSFLLVWYLRSLKPRTALG